MKIKYLLGFLAIPFISTAMAADNSQATVYIKNSLHIAVNVTIPVKDGVWPSVPVKAGSFFRLDQPFEIDTRSEFSVFDNRPVLDGFGHCQYLTHVNRNTKLFLVTISAEKIVDNQRTVICSVAAN